MTGGPLLMIAYHVPPSAEVSGAVRTLAFAHYLAEEGVTPTILAPSVRAYPLTRNSAPISCDIVRAFALDARRHLGIAGRFPRAAALPDRWISWWPAAVAKGLRWIERHRPRAIWSTYPIATAHLIAYALHRRTGVPWIADFRDPVRPPDGQEQSMVARSRAWVERLTVENANACVFVTAGAQELYARRYAGRAGGELVVIPNGYDEEAFAALPTKPPQRNDQFFTMVHSGVLYPRGRNPEPFFAALANLVRTSRLNAGRLKIILRASDAEATYAPMVQRYGLEEVVELAPPVGRAEALQEQQSADALLLFQGREFNQQIPAKAYEYFRVGRPILALADMTGETARLISQANVGCVLPIDDVSALETGIPDFMADVVRGRFKAMIGGELEKYSRQNGASELHALLGRVAP